MNKFIQRVKVVASTFVTYAVLVCTAASAAVATLQASDVPGAAQAASWGALAVTYVTSVVSVVRKVTQVPDDLVGLLLPEEPDFYQSVDDFERFWGDQGEQS